jgi:hypothetical protein
MSRAVLAAIIVAVLIAPAFAETTRGDKLLAWCSDSRIDRGCAAYVHGVLELAQAQKIFCPPSGLRVGQTVDMVVKLLNAKPELRRLDAPTLILQATEPFHCHN